jgi:hypothetical protein
MSRAVQSTCGDRRFATDIHNLIQEPVHVTVWKVLGLKSITGSRPPKYITINRKRGLNRLPSSAIPKIPFLRHPHLAKFCQPLLHTVPSLHQTAIIPELLHRLSLEDRLHLRDRELIAQGGTEFEYV